MAKTEVSFPFVPKTTRQVRPGDYWDIPLDSGGYACGRVMQLDFDNGRLNSKSLLVGLVNWSGDSIPTEREIAGRRILRQGATHIRTIGEVGGMIRGRRALEKDGLAPWVFRDAEYAQWIQCGVFPLREYNEVYDSDLPVFEGWGYLFIKEIAEHLFGKKTAKKRSKKGH